MDAAADAGGTHGSLNPAAIHRASGHPCRGGSPANIREQPARVAMAAPVTPQVAQGLIRQWHIAVLAALALADMDPMLGCINVPHL